MSYPEWKDSKILHIARGHGVDMQRVPFEALDHCVDEGHDRGWHEGIIDGAEGFVGWLKTPKATEEVYIPSEILDQALKAWQRHKRGEK